MKLSKQSKLYIAITIAIMAFIFVQSALPADLSANESSFFVPLFMNLFKTDAETASFIIRKGAHFTEYTILGLSLAVTVRTILAEAAERKKKTSRGAEEQSPAKEKNTSGGAVEHNLAKEKMISGGAVEHNLAKEKKISSEAVEQSLTKEQNTSGGAVEHSLAKEKMISGGAVEHSLAKEQNTSGGAVEHSLTKSGSSLRLASAGLIAWGIGALYAVTDELHQMLVSGRSCEFRDMLIDWGGVLLGVLIITLIRYFRRSREV